MTWSSTTSAFAFFAMPAATSVASKAGLEKSVGTRIFFICI
jgi:hypothetical protein